MQYAGCFFILSIARSPCLFAWKGIVCQKYSLWLVVAYDAAPTQQDSEPSLKFRRNKVKKTYVGLDVLQVLLVRMGSSASSSFRVFSECSVHVRIVKYYICSRGFAVTSIMYI